jgi:hypothetical protein
VEYISRKYIIILIEIFIRSSSSSRSPSRETSKEKFAKGGNRDPSGDKYSRKKEMKRTEEDR